MDNDEVGKKFLERHLFNNTIQYYKDKEIKIIVSFIRR